MPQVFIARRRPVNQGYGLGEAAPARSVGFEASGGASICAPDGRAAAAIVCGARLRPPAGQTFHIQSRAPGAGPLRRAQTTSLKASPSRTT